MIDIIIKSWNAVNYTKLAVSSIKKSLRVPYRIIVVDDGSTKETVNELAKIEGIDLIRHEKNLGPAATAITGFENSNSEIAVLMDNDIVVDSGWLEKMLAYFDDPDTAIVSPLKISSIYKYPETTKSSKSIWESIEDKYPDYPTQALTHFLQNRSINEFCDQLVNFNNITDQVLECPPAFTSSCFILTKRKLVNQAGGIARKIFTTYGGEDVDLCWRLGEKGLKVVKTASVYVHHFEHSSMNSNKKNIANKLSYSNQLLYNLWSDKILSLAVKLKEKYPEEIIETRFPFIKVMEDIKKYGNARTF